MKEKHEQHTFIHSKHVARMAEGCSMFGSFYTFKFNICLSVRCATHTTNSESVSLHFDLVCKVNNTIKLGGRISWIIYI